MEELLTVDEVAKRLRVTPETITGWLRGPNPVLVGYRFKGVWRIKADSVEKMLLEALNRKDDGNV